MTLLNSKGCRLLEQHVSYLSVMKGRSENTIDEYRNDLLMFFKFIKDSRNPKSKILDIENNSFDYVFANMYLHHVESPSKAIKEMARILKTGGKLILTDLDEHQFDFLKTEHHDRWMGFQREDIKKWLSNAGLANASVDCVGQNCCAESACGCEKAAISIF